MKNSVFAFCMLFGAAVYAQDSTSTTSPTDPTSTTPSTSMAQEDGRVKIKSQDLPDAVKKSLEGQDFRGWLVNSSYKVKSSNVNDDTSISATGATATEVYIVELKNGAQTKTVRFDKDGKKLDDQGMNDDQKK
jgi:hypothetical protein